MNESCLVTKRKTHRVNESLVVQTITDTKKLAQSLGVTEDLLVQTMIMLELRRANDLAVVDSDQTDVQVYEVGQTLESISKLLEAIRRALSSKELSSHF